MTSDEKLRDLFLELRMVRDREPGRHTDPSALLAALEEFATAADPRTALDGIVHAAAQMVGADRALVLEGDAGSAVVLHAAEADDLGHGLDTPVDLFGKARVLDDIRRDGAWTGSLDLSGTASLMTVPFTEGGRSCALVAVAASHTAFARRDVPLLVRLTGLAAQALRTLRLAEENALLAAVIQNSAAAFTIADARDPRLPLVYVNRAFEDLTGYPAAEVLGQNCRFLSDEPADSPERSRLRDTLAACGSGRFLLRNRTRDGRRFWNDLSLFPVCDADGVPQHIVATQIDATDRVRAEEEAESTRRRMERALQATKDGFLVFGRDGRVIFANPGMLRLFETAGVDWAPGSLFAENWAMLCDSGTCAHDRRGASAAARPDPLVLAETGEVQAVDLTDGRSLILAVAPIDADTLVATVTDVTLLKSAERELGDRAAAMEAAQDGIALADGAGALVYMNGSARHLLDGCGPGARWRDAYEDAPAEADRGRWRLNRRGAGEVVHEVTLSPLPEGGAVLILRDVTGLIAQERQRAGLQAALAKSQRQEAVGRLTAGIAHDFNNMLSAIHGSTQLLELDASVSEEAQSHVRRIAAAGARAAKMVNRLLDLGAESQPQGRFDLRSAVDDLRALVGLSLPRSIALQIDPGAEALMVRGSSGSFGQIVVNLVLNARDALVASREDAGTIRVELDAPPPQEARQLAQGRLVNGQAYARISVTDNGPGIPEEMQARVFDAYVSSKGAGGTGLGLSVVATMAREAGGAVDLISAPGQGTRVDVYIPLDPDSGRVAEDALPDANMPDLSGLTVLVVDDEEQVGEVIGAYLERLGAEVAICVDADLAQATVEEDPGGWSALVTDYDMPGMNGSALVDRVHAVAPDLPVFLVTALARRLSDPGLAPPRVRQVFSKPADLSSLAAAIAAACGGSRSGH